MTAGEPTSVRLVNALQAAHGEGLIEFIGGSEYAVRVDRTSSDAGCSVVRCGTTEQMWSWLNGMKRGSQLPGRDGWWSNGGVDQAVARLVRAQDQVSLFRQLVLQPTLADAIRVQVLAGMERAGWNFADLAAKISRSDQTVREALLFGGPNPRIGNMALFDLMLRAMGETVCIRVPVVRSGADVVEHLSGARDEPAGVARMRALVISVERRLIDGVSPTALQRARRTREFTLSVAGHDVVRPRDTLVHWLRGLADGSGDVRAMEALNLA